MSTKSWIMSLTLPVISCFAGIVLLLFNCGPFTFIFGALGGLVPALIIMIKKVDLSQFFVGKIILTGALAVGIIFSWTIAFIWLSHSYNVFVLPLLVFIAEAVFAATRKADILQKVCLVLSSLLYVYIGVVIDIVLYFRLAE